MRLASNRDRLYLLILLCLIAFITLLFYYNQPTEDGFFVITTYTEQKLDEDPVAMTTRLPRTVGFVHQSWNTADLPPRFQRWSKTWRKCFPKARHILWTDADNRNFVAKHYPWFLERYDELASNSHPADAVRYLYMFHYGGIYADLDNECLRPFAFLLTNTSMAFGAVEGEGNTPEGNVQNSFMYSVPRHPMWLELIQKIVRSPKMIHSDNTGSGLLTETINAYRERLKTAANITVYPPAFFDPFSWRKKAAKECKRFNAMTEEEHKACRAVLVKTSYVVQYHARTRGRGNTLQ